MTTSEPRPDPTLTPERVRDLLSKTDLQVDGHPYEITVTSPARPECGIIHIATDDGYVSLEKNVWYYWGALEGYQDPATDEAAVTISKIIQTLAEPPSPLNITPPAP